MGHWHWIVVERRSPRRGPLGILGPAVDDETSARQGAAEASQRPFTPSGRSGEAQGAATRRAIGVLECAGDCAETAGQWVTRWSASAR